MSAKSPVTVPTLAFDEQFRTGDIRIICGTDEAGRGPLAGPVVAAACILPDGYMPEGLNDSKKLTEKKRDALYEIITRDAVAWCAASASPEEIDEINILEASLLAMRRAVAGLGIRPDFLLIDGNVNRGFDLPARAIVSGDALSPSIAAASIIAKVTRDRLCADYETLYPGYGFAGHKGYPTPAHKLVVFEKGPCPIHRRSFLGFIERDRDKLQAALDKKRAGEQ
ncbi:MAG: ribonuclease HII [Ruminococcaceae bacterium]|nr:ribonuclease HII [Oscillospiraceae bacterium]